MRRSGSTASIPRQVDGVSSLAGLLEASAETHRRAQIELAKHFFEQLQATGRIVEREIESDINIERAASLCPKA